MSATKSRPQTRPRPQSYFEMKCVGPEDQVIDVSNAGWIGAMRTRAQRGRAASKSQNVSRKDAKTAKFGVSN